VRKFTAAQRKLIREQEAEIFKNIDKLAPERRIIAEAVARERRREDLRAAGTPEVGLFFVVDGKVFAEGEPWTEVQSVAGFRTYSLDHDRFWRRLQRMGAVGKDLEYDKVPRGRVTYEDSSHTFTLFADKHIIASKRQINSVIKQFSLLKNTKILPDDHYRCPKCLGRSKSKKQEEDDWDF